MDHIEISNLEIAMKLTVRSDLSESNLRFAEPLGVTHIMTDAGRWMDAQQRGPLQKRWARGWKK